MVSMAISSHCSELAPSWRSDMCSSPSSEGRFEGRSKDESRVWWESGGEGSARERPWSMSICGLGERTPRAGVQRARSSSSSAGGVSGAEGGWSGCWERSRDGGSSDMEAVMDKGGSCTRVVLSLETRRDRGECRRCRRSGLDGAGEEWARVEQQAAGGDDMECWEEAVRGRLVVFVLAVFRKGSAPIKRRHQRRHAFLLLGRYGIADERRGRQGQSMNRAVDGWRLISTGRRAVRGQRRDGEMENRGNEEEEKKKEKKKKKRSEAKKTAKEGAARPAQPSPNKVSLQLWGRAAPLALPQRA